MIVPPFLDRRSHAAERRRRATSALRRLSRTRGGTAWDTRLLTSRSSGHCLRGRWRDRRSLWGEQYPRRRHVVRLLAVPLTGFVLKARRLSSGVCSGP